MTKFLTNIDILLLQSFLCSFIMILLQLVKELEAKNHFCILAAGADNSNGVNFEQHRKLLSLWTSAVSFRRTALNSDFT